jgi:hypothetical protein
MRLSALLSKALNLALAVPITTMCLALSASADNGVGRPIIGGMQPPQASDQSPAQTGAQGGGSAATQILAVTGLSAGPQNFSHAGHSFNITPASNFRLQVIQKGNSGKAFNFLGPKRDNNTYCIFTVMILARTPNHPMLTKEQLTGAMIAPYKSKLKNLAINAMPITLAGGHQETGVEFSGEGPNNTKARGFVDVIPVNDGFYILSGSDRGEYWDQSLRTFDGMVSTLSIQN